VSDVASVQEHYDAHLGAIYGWMVGDFDAACEAARTELRAAGIASGGGRVAVDLGAGPGAHAIALADRGFAVTAIDSCTQLLSELRSHAGSRTVTCVDDDLRNLRRHVGTADVIVCMGDTLTHLPSGRSVEELFSAIAETLRPGGTFVATFRDYTRTLDGVSRFIPVRQDGRRILTCFLEFHEATVKVHDLLHERLGGEWTLRVSSYAKLRLDPEWARAALARAGLDARLDAEARGMIRVVARRS
jgi:SAM-dependent methyltransferase